MKPKVTAVVGGGPAGASVAKKLARGGAQVVIFEEKIGWEKPCGGGLSHNALRHYPFLGEGAGQGKCIRDAEFVASEGTSLRFRLRQPVAIYARSTLNQLLLRDAEAAGAEVIQDRIVGFRRAGWRWELQGQRRAYSADFLVLAAGARTRLRRLCAEGFSARDFMLTLGYFVPASDDVLRIQFFQDLAGYVWAFPRQDHLSVGICGKGGKNQMSGLRERLQSFMRRFGYSTQHAVMYSHLLPSLTVESWHNLRLTGPDWAMVGDTAGLVDPVTGEGIYYAMRSGELLAESLLEEAPELYPARVWQEFGKALALRARLAHLFYRGDFLGGTVPIYLVEFGARSQKFLEVIQDLIEGSQSYLGVATRFYLGLTRNVFAIAAASLREAMAVSKAV